MSSGLESRCVFRVYGAEGVVRLVLSSSGVVRVNDQSLTLTRIYKNLFVNSNELF